MTTSLQCTAPQCAFKTMQGTVDQVLQHLSLHAQTAHPVQQAQGGGTARGKVDRPTMKPACDQESWAFFLYDWENYKSAMNITGNAISAHLFGCLDEELKRDLQKAHQGVAAATMSEADLLQAIKRLAVKEESKLAHRIKMGRAIQQPGASIRTFHAHLKGLAAPCEYQISHTCGCGKTNNIDYSDNVIQDQLVRGIADQEILADLLGDEKSDRTTKEIVEFIARKEQDWIYVDFSCMSIMVLLQKTRASYVPRFNFGGLFFNKKFVVQIANVQKYSIFAKYKDFSKQSQGYSFQLRGMCF